MSDKDKYPGWGAFGTAIETIAPEQRPEVSLGTGSTWELTESVRIGANGEKVLTVEYTKDDPQELVQQALARRDIQAAKEAFQSPAGTRYKLTGERDVLSAVIELARALAIDYSDLHSVWAALLMMARTPEKFPPLLGITDDGKDIRYSDGKPHATLLTKRALKSRMDRQEKARKGS